MQRIIMAKTPRRKSKRVEKIQVDDASQPLDPGSMASPSANQSQGSTTSEASPPIPQDSPTSSDTPIQPTKPRRSRSRAPADETPEATNSSSARDKSSRRNRHLIPEPISQDKECLFNLIKQDSVSLREIAAKWIQSYNENPQQALAVLFEFIVRTSDCPISITADMLDDIDATIINIEQSFTTESKDFPLIRKFPPWPTFTSNFINFLRVVILQCQNSIVYDDYLIDSLKVLLGELTSSEISSLRYTSTLVLLKLLTILQEIDLTVKETRDITLRQLQSENEKSPEEKSLNRIQSLHAKAEELQENRKELNKLLDDLLKKIFAPRATDILVEIRYLCLEELATWLDQRFIKYYHSLKYIGYGLSDKSSDVRLKSLKILQSIYSSQAPRDRLQEFNEQFKKRIVLMPLDKEDNVSVEAVKLMTIIYENWREILSETDYEVIYQLVLCKNRNLAQVSGEFVMKICTNNDHVSGVSEDTGETSQSNDSLLKHFVDFFVESEQPEYAAYLVDAVIDNHQVVQDWECMTRLLLNDAEEEGLSNDNLLGLVKLMVASIEQSATGGIPLGRAPQKRVLLAREQRKVAFDREQLTEHFIHALPLLLTKYSSDYGILANLLRIPQYFYLDMYVKIHQEKQLGNFLDEMRKIVEKTTDTNTLRALSKTLEYLCSDKHVKSSQCNTQRSFILDDIIQRYKEAIDNYERLIAGNEELGDDDNSDVIESSKKLAIFISCHDINHYSIYQSLFKIIESIKNPSDKFPEEGIRCTMQICYYTLLWWRNTLNTSEELVDEAEAEAQVEVVARKLKKYTDKLLTDLQYFVGNECFTPAIREEAYKIMCDLLMTFNKLLATNDTIPLLHDISYEPDDSTREILNDFLQNNVFIHENSSNDEFYSRRNLLMAFCKLIMSHVFPIKSAANVFKHYDAFYNDYGDIIKMTLGKAKEINKMNWVLTMQFSLNILFDESMEKSGESVDADDLKGMINLAKRFAVSLGIDTTRIQDEIKIIHGAGINFVAARSIGEEMPSTDVPPKLPYLQVLAEFSSKLLREAKDEVLKMLDTILPIGGSRDTEWQPLMNYRRSLVGGRRGNRDEAGVSGDAEGETRATDETANRSAGAQKRKRTLRKTPLSVMKVKGVRRFIGKATGDEESMEGEVHSVSRDIDNRLQRMAAKGGEKPAEEDLGEMIEQMDVNSD